MDLKDKGLINATVSTDALLTELTEESLMNENWLFTYESIKKGWLEPAENPIDQNKYFEILLANEVFFYRESARVNTFTIKKPNTITKESKTTPKPESANTIVLSGDGNTESY